MFGLLIETEEAAALARASECPEHIWFMRQLRVSEYPQCARCGVAKRLVDRQLAKAKQDRRMQEMGGWRCVCGSVNVDRDTCCFCAKPKYTPQHPAKQSEGA